MKLSFAALGGLAAAALMGGALLAGCGGGSSTAVPVPTTALPPLNGSVPIGSLNLNQPASSTPVNLTSTTPAGPTVDVHDRATVRVTNAVAGMPAFSDVTQHAFAGSLRGASGQSARRATKALALNSPFDLIYHAGTVLGSAVSHNLFVDCFADCRAAYNIDPGAFLDDLGTDLFLSIVNQYQMSPGVILSGPPQAFTKGLGGDLSVNFASNPIGGSNPYFGQLAIWLQVLNAAGPPGQPTSLGGGGLGHIYHVILTQNVDTCKESPPGTPTHECYSPDVSAYFQFCGYHGAFTATSGNQRQTYLYTVEPYADVRGCRPQLYHQPLPNGSSAPGVNPADPLYMVLSHELFETITDPLGGGWYNNLLGDEIGDLCTDFDNFVTVNGHRYVLQSEYSDINHLCVSANLTTPAQTPQSAKRSH